MLIMKLLVLSTTLGNLEEGKCQTLLADSKK